MKIVTAHVRIKYILYFSSLICLSALLFCFLHGSKADPTEIAKTETESEFSTNTSYENEMRDKNGKPYVPTGNITVYLTFDDGPSKNTPQILSVLEKYGIGATFFVINGKYNGYLKDIAESKSVIALHSYSHKYPEIYSSEQAFLDDLEKIHNLVLEETGIDTKIIRFPGGTSNTISRRYCKGIMSNLVKDVEKEGYIYFDWNCDNGDANGKETGAEYQLKKASLYPKNAENIVILMHDINSCGVNIEALSKIIDFYQSKGADFGVITENSPQVRHKINN